MANEINIGINTTSDLSGLNQVDESVKSLKTQLKEAQANVAALSEKFGATSKEAVEAAKSAAILRDKIGDAKSLTDAFNPDAKFKALSGSLTGVAGGFSAVTGALGLMGKESKDVEQAILKVQSAMAFAGGVQALGESIDSFKQLGAVIKSTTIFQRIATAAQWLWNAALNANPIGAVVVAITALIGVGYLMIKMFKSSTESVEASKEAIEKNKKAVEKETEALEENRKKKEQLQDYELRLMKARGKSDEAIAKRAIVLAKENEQEAWKEYHLKRTTLEMAKNTIATYESTQAKVDDQMASVTWMSTEWGLLQQRKDINKQDLKEAKEKLNSLILANNSAAKVVDEAHNKRILAEQNLNVIIAQNQTNANKEAAENQKKIDDDKLAKQKELREKQQNEKKSQLEKDKQLAEKYTREEEDLLADTETKKAILLHRRNSEEIAQMKDLNAKKIALQNEYDANVIRMNAAMEADKEAEYNKSVEFMKLQDGNFEVSLQKQLEHYEHLKTIQEDYGKSTIEIDKQIAETKAQIAEDNYNKAVAIIQQENNDNLDQQNNVLKHYEDLRDKLILNGQSTIAIEKEIAEQKKLIAKTELEYKDFTINKGIEVAGQAGQLLQQIAGNSKEAAIGGIVLEKAASIASIIASTFATNAKFTGHPASILSFGTAAAAPVALNTASGVIGIASIIAQASKSIAEINNTKSDAETPGKTAPSKFATGGMVTGMGTSTSDSIMARLSNGESVINAKSTAMFGNLLSNINQAGGGVAFGNQNNANPIFKTYVVASEMTSQIEANLKLKQIARL
jgi:hypothetical protein